MPNFLYLHYSRCVKLLFYNTYIIQSPLQPLSKQKNSKLYFLPLYISKCFPLQRHLRLVLSKSSRTNVVPVAKLETEKKRGFRR